MDIAKWSDDYSTGNSMVDNEHKQLFGMVNRLHEVITNGDHKDVAGPVLRNLVSYTDKHFSHEERLMKDSGYPGYDGHKAKHEDLKGQAIDLMNKYESGVQVLNTTLVSFLTKWLVEHINQEDKKMIAWVKSH